MPQKMFRLTDDEVKALKNEAYRRGCTQTEVIRSCILSFGKDTQGDIREDTQKTAAGDALSRVVSMLESELEIKNAQISDLSRALAAAHDTAKAAQALHAQERMALESSEQKEERKTRWQRLKEAWNG